MKRVRITAKMRGQDDQNRGDEAMRDRYENLINGIEAVCEGHASIETIGALASVMATCLSKMDSGIGTQIFIGVSKEIMKFAYPNIDFNVVENEEGLQ